MHRRKGDQDKGSAGHTHCLRAGNNGHRDVQAYASTLQLGERERERGGDEGGEGRERERGGMREREREEEGTVEG